MKASLTQTGTYIALAAAALVAGSVLLLAVDASYWSAPSGEPAMRLFQRSVGGLGMGAASTPAWNLLYYDPRLQPVDDSNLWPVPGSYPYSPSAVSTVVPLRESPRDDLEIIKVK